MGEVVAILSLSALLLVLVGVILYIERENRRERAAERENFEDERVRLMGAFAEERRDFAKEREALIARINNPVGAALADFPLPEARDTEPTPDEYSEVVEGSYDLRIDDYLEVS